MKSNTGHWSRRRFLATSGAAALGSMALNLVGGLPRAAAAGSVVSYVDTSRSTYDKIALMVDGDTPRPLEIDGLKRVVPVPEDMPLDKVIDRLVDNEGPIPVVDAEGHYCGAISKGRLLTRLQGESHE